MHWSMPDWKTHPDQGNLSNPKWPTCAVWLFRDLNKKAKGRFDIETAFGFSKCRYDVD